MFVLLWSFCLLRLSIFKVIGCSVLKDNEIYQEVPPKGNFGTNYDAFDELKGL